MARKMKDSGVEWIGDIPEDWEISKIKYGVEKVGSGKTPRGGAETYPEQGILFLRSQNIYDTGINLESPTYISEETDENMKNTRVFPDDVLLNITGGSIGRCCIFPQELKRANVNQHVSIIRVNKDVFTPEYVHYFWICSLGKNAIDLYQTGGNREGMSADAIKNTFIPYIPIEKQRKITSYLDKACRSIDTGIEKTKETIDTYKSLKQSLITRAVTKGIRGEREMKDSGIEWIGEVPTDWKIVNLKRTGTFDNGLTYSPTDVKDDGVLVLRSSNIQEGKLDYKDCVYVGEVPDNLIVKKGDIIICSRNGSAKLVGKCALVNDEVNATFGAFMMRYRTKLNNMFAYYLLQVAITENRYLFTTTTINQLTRGIIGQIKVPYPKESEQQEIVDYLDEKCSAIDTLIAKKEQFLSELETYKKSLIYEYVTGKREVPA